MNPTDKCRRLADAILAGFEDGIIIDDRTQQYINACLPEMSVEEVAQRICETPDLDTAPLMELIFFPNESFQVKLEPLLETETYTPDDEIAVVTLLSIAAVRTTLQKPEGEDHVAIQVPAWALAPFVQRLNISRCIPPDLANAISSRHSQDTAIRLKVMLRNTRFFFTGPFSDFLEAFILGMGAEDMDFDLCFELILELLGERESEPDPFRLLRLKMDMLHKTRDAALHFEKQLAHSNMETLMHQGFRAPEISSAVAEKKIALLEHIGGAVAIGGCKTGNRERNRSSFNGEFESKDGSPIPR